MESGNHTWPDFKRTTDECEIDWNLHREDKFREAWIQEIDGRPVALGIIREAYWAAEGRRFFLELNLFPDARIETVHPLAEMMEERAVKAGAKTLVTEICDLYSDIFDHWIERGYRSEMDGHISRLDTSAFSRSKVARGLDKFAASNGTVVGLNDLDWQDETFQRALYEVRWEIRQDIPDPSKPEREPFERFVAMWLSDTIVPRESFFISFEDGMITGYTSGRRMLAMPDKYETFTTGVARAYRRKGVATALKVAIIEWCQAQGIRWIETGNEVNNPMYDLNVALGFEKWCGFCVLEKAVTE